MDWQHFVERLDLAYEPEQQPQADRIRAMTRGSEKELQADPQFRCSVEVPKHCSLLTIMLGKAQRFEMNLPLVA